MKPQSSLAGILFTMFVIPVIGITGSMRAAEAAVQQGVQHIQAGQYMAAVQAFDRALQQAPSHYDALMGKGRAFLLQGSAQPALVTCDAAIRQRSDMAEAYACRGSAYAGLGQLKAAMGDWEESLRLDPNQKQLLQERANIYFAAGQLKEAVEELKRYAALDKTDAKARLQLATALRDLGKNAEAIPWFDEVLRLDPQMKAAYRYRAYAKADVGLKEGAIADLGQVLGNAAGDAEDYHLRGLLENQIAKVEEARADVERAAALTASADLKRKWLAESDEMWMAALTAERDDHRRAALLERWQLPEGHRLYPKVRELAFVTYRRANLNDKALRIAEEDIAAGKGTLLQYVFAVEQVSRGQREPAKVAVYSGKAAELMTPDTDPVLRRDIAYLKGMAHMQMQQFPAANEDLRSALKAGGTPEWRASVLLLLGYANYQMRLPLESIRFYKEALAIPGNHQRQVAQNIEALKSEFQINWDVK